MALSAAGVVEEESGWRAPWSSSWHQQVTCYFCYFLAGGSDKAHLIVEGRDFRLIYAQEATEIQPSVRTGGVHWTSKLSILWMLNL